MIPGIHNLNTVGTSPLKRGARQILGVSSRVNTTELNGEQTEMTGLNAIGLNRTSYGASQSMKVLPPYQNQSPRHLTNDGTVRIAEQKESGADPDKYNPITNPISWYGQNPYINKEKTFVKSNARITNLIS